MFENIYSNYENFVESGELEEVEELLSFESLYTSNFLLNSSADNRCELRYPARTELTKPLLNKLQKYPPGFIKFCS